MVNIDVFRKPVSKKKENSKKNRMAVTSIMRYRVVFVFSCCFGGCLKGNSRIPMLFYLLLAASALPLLYAVMANGVLYACFRIASYGHKEEAA